MPESKFEKLLQAILRDVLAAEPSYYIRRVQTFEEAAVLLRTGVSWSQWPTAPSIKSRLSRVGELERTHGDPETL